MATTPSSTQQSCLSNVHSLSIHHLSRSVERALDEATLTGELVLSGRKLREFPTYFDGNHKCDLSDTTTADLSRNRFIEFPRILCSFFSLDRLNLYDNAIKFIPDQIIQIYMLKILDLSRNQLACIPSALCNLPNLEVLILNNNKLLSLPNEIGQLERLIELDVSTNEITQLPHQIGSLNSLRTLNIRRNMIAELPAELCQLKLTHLDCSYNRLIRLPLHLRDMITLIEFNVEQNPLESPPTAICALGLLHIMRYLLVEAMKEEKQRGLLTEHEINAKYRNSFFYEGSRHLPWGTRVRKSVVPSDSGYLTTEGSEKTIGDDDSIISMSNDHSEPTLMLTLADEFSKELARQKAAYDKKKCQAQQLKRHLLQQLGETENQRAKTREVARRTHDEKLAKMEKQREDARRKMENRNFQLFHYPAKNDDRREHVWSSSTKPKLIRQSSNIESVDDSVENSTRSFSIGHSTAEQFISRPNRAASVEPSLIAGGKEMKMNHGHHRAQQKCSAHRSIDASISSQNLNHSRTNQSEENRLARLRYFDNRQSNQTSTMPAFHMQSKVPNGQQQQTSAVEHAEVNQAFAIRRHLLQTREDYLQLEQMKQIIENRLKVTLPDDLGYTLSDGVVLCHFINQIRPRAVPSIHVPSQTVSKLSLAKCRRNVENFIDASRRLGVPEIDLCTSQEILEQQKPVRLARHIHLLISAEPFEQTNV